MIIDRVDEELLLFALEPDGRWTRDMDSDLHRALAAAWLAELMVEGRLRLLEGKLTTRTRSPIGDPTLDWTMEMIRRPKRPKRVRTWIRRLSRRAAPHVPKVLERLHGRGHIEIVGHGRDTLYPSRDQTGRNQLREHLRMVLFGQRGADDSSVALLAVLDGAGLTEHVFGPELARQGEPLLDRLLHRDHRFALLRDILTTRKRRRRKARQQKVTLMPRAPARRG